VKEAIREYGRTVAIFAAAGLVLSLLVGVLARNPFGVMVVRAVIFAILFGALGAGMQYVVRRFLPELTGESPQRPEDAAAAEAPRGSKVDIVLPEELPQVEPAPEGSAEPLEELPGTADNGAAAPVEELGPAEESAAPDREGTPNAGPPAKDAFEELPDIAPATASGGGERTGASRRGPAFPGARPKPSDATRELLERQDPAVLARGLRTMLKRDEHS
jgi:hypothetical protein